MMTKTANFAARNRPSFMVDNEMTRSLYTRYHGALPPRRDSAPAKLIIRTVGSFLVLAGKEMLRSFPFFRKVTRAVFRERLLFETVNRKKEKRGRRSPCGLSSSRAQACLVEGQ
jgi:hypothetical protein